MANQASDVNIPNVPIKDLERFDRVCEKAGLTRPNALRNFIAQIAEGELTLVRASIEKKESASTK